MKTVNFELTNPIKYSNGSGDEIESNVIEIKAPTGKISHLVGILKVEIGTATKNSIKGMDLSTVGDESDSEKESTPEEIGEAGFQMLVMGGANMPKVMTTFKEILKESAIVGGEKNFTMPMFDRMDYIDVENCLKSYIGNFTQAS